MTVKTAALPYTIRERRDDDLAAILDLMRISLGESTVLQRTQDMWNWKHEINPFGRSHVLLAENDEGKIIGLRAFLRWEFGWDGRSLRGVRAVDTSTHPDFRRMGLFKNLTLQAVDDVRNDGVDFVFNTPNDQSRPGYLKMGWQSVGLVEPVIKILNYPRFVVGMAKARLLKREANAPDGSHFAANEPSTLSDLVNHAGLDELLEADTALRPDLMHTKRSAAYLDWRYAKHPTIDYRTVLIEENGKLEAAAVFRANSRFGLREIVLAEMLLARPDRDLAKKLIRVVKSHVKADYMIAYFPKGSAHRDALRGSSFRRIPGQGMTLTANALSGPLGDFEALDRWGLSLGDLELF